MTRTRRRWFSFLADLAIRLTRNQFGRKEMNRRMKRMSFETDVSRLGVRMTETLRDRLRRRWLKVRREK